MVDHTRKAQRAMANIIANELERFRRDIQEVQKKIATMEQAYRNMFEEIYSLSGMWEGGAHDTYMAQFQTDTQNMEQVFKNLKAFQESLNEAYVKFGQCEQSVEEVVRRVQV